MKVAIIYHPARMRATEDKIHGPQRKLPYPTLARVRKAFQCDGHKVTAIDGRGDLFAKIRRAKPDMVFNWYAVPGGAQAYVPALLERMEVPYTGCSALCHALAMDKGLTSKVLAHDKLSVPPFAMVSRKRRQPSAPLDFPVLVKPCALGSSEGISEDSFAASRDELAGAIDVALAVDRQAIITKYLPGRELTVGVIGNDELQILPILEKHLETKPGRPRIFTGKMKKRYAHWHHNVTVPDLGAAQEATVKETAAKAYRGLGCTDCARVDIRLGADGTPWVLEVNTLPGIYPKFSPLTKMANEMGKRTEYLARRILEVARVRYGL